MALHLHQANKGGGTAVGAGWICAEAQSGAGLLARSGGLRSAGMPQRQGAADSDPPGCHNGDSEIAAPWVPQRRFGDRRSLGAKSEINNHQLRRGGVPFFLCASAALREILFRIQAASNESYWYRERSRAEAQRRRGRGLEIWPGLQPLMMGGNDPGALPQATIGRADGPESQRRTLNVERCGSKSLLILTQSHRPPLKNPLSLSVTSASLW